MDSSGLDNQTRTLVQRLAHGCEHNNLGTATIAIYDTAWVSMITKTFSGQTVWLFPECFHFLLNCQMPDGGWESYGSADDGLLNTLAGLLALERHRDQPDLTSETDISDLEARIRRAREYIQRYLRDWDVDVSVHVGFEILIPALLSMLEHDSVYFDFDGRQCLSNLNAIKLAKFDPEMLYTSPKTLTHSFEAFIDVIDFDRVRSHRVFGSMMASPASTAAYLMNASLWDDEAELYIRRVVQEGLGKGNGGVPCVFPTTIFEVTWTISTLLQSGFTIDVLGEDNLERIANYLQKNLQDQQGLLGFAPLVLADADDTAKAHLLLNLLGKETFPDIMINHFRSKHGHFSTYPGERDASFSANCNVLKALLESPRVKDYEVEVTSITSFLCDCWWSGHVKDKWNLSFQYCTMLLVEGLVRLLELWDRGVLNNLPIDLLRDRITVVIVQVLNRTLLTPLDTGTWYYNSYPEAIAYSILTLSEIEWVADIVGLKDEVTSAIQEWQNHLIQIRDKWTKPQYLWIEKVTFGSCNLSEAYCLAALKLKHRSYVLSDMVRDLFDIPQTLIIKHSQFLSTISMFQNKPFWNIKASVIEGCTFLAQLKSARTDILPCQKEAKNRYLDLVPCTWIIVNNHNRLSLPADMLWDMMVLTVCNFRVDEYMESTGAKLMGDNLEEARSVINGICGAEEVNKLMMKVGPSAHPARSRDASKTPLTASEMNAQAGLDTIETDVSHEINTAADEDNMVSSLSSFRATIKHYVHAMLYYPQIQQASYLDLSNLSHQIRTFLLSHIDQLEDNSRFATQTSSNTSAPGIFLTPRAPFYTWAHTTGAESVSCPFSFAFFTCILGSASRSLQNRATDVFGTLQQNYLAQDLCAHLAVMSRFYNDFGSAARDRAEANISSMNFAEFHRRADSVGNKSLASEHDGILKGELLWLAEHERRCVDLALERLIVEMGGREGRVRRGSEMRKADAMRLFVGVAKLYADLYVAKDLSNALKREK